MDANGLESHEESVERAGELVERLLVAADGGPGVGVGQYEASTILALLTDELYRNTVLRRVEGFEGEEGEG